MLHDWRQLLRQVKADHHEGATALLRRGIEAARLFLLESRALPPSRVASALAQFTVRLTESQPSMAPFMTLANALWLGVEGRPGDSWWNDLHDALVRYADRTDRNLQRTLRHTAGLVRSEVLVLTHSHSTAVRMALLQALAAGRHFEVVCSESRPMGEGMALARHLARAGISVHLTTDAALAGWVERAHLVLLGADAVFVGRIANKVGTQAILHAARRGRVPAYALADSSKWLPESLAGFWRVREEAPGEIAHPRHVNLHVDNRYFELAPLALLTGLAWEEGIGRPAEIRRRIAGLAVSRGLMRLLRRRKKSREA